MGMVKMRHMNVYGPGRDPQCVLELLARLACFDADDAGTLGAANGKDDPYAPLLGQVTGLLKDLGADSVPGAFHGEAFTLEEARPFVEKFTAEVARRGKEKTEMDAKLATYEQAKAQLYHLTGLQTSMDEIFSCKYLKVRFGRLPKDSYVKLPYYEGHSFTFRQFDFDGEYYWGMYFVPEQSAEEVDRIFSTLYFERIWVPDFVHGTPQDALAQILSEEAEMAARRKELDNLADIATPAEVQQLQKIAAWLNYESQIAQMYSRVVLLDNSYYISGFVPQDSVQALRDAVKNTLPEVRVCADDELGTPAAPAAQLHPPTKLANNWLLRPFEMFVTMYGLPAYGDIDPTPFVAVTYAILFGVMFGDVGQGVLLGLVGYFVMYKKLHMQLGLILTRCSVFSVLFGFVYGSVFGFEHALDGLYRALGFAGKPVEVMETNTINGILITSVAAGVCIIVCAMAAGILSDVRRGEKVKAVVSVNGVAGLVFYLSIIGLLLPMLGFSLPFIGTPVYIALGLVVPFLCMYFSETLCRLAAGEHPGKPGEILINGFFEMFDAVLSFASNTMSFLRVGGFVLAHAGMMSVVFTLAEMAGGNVVLYAVIAAAGNVFVMALEGLFVGIQVLRLEFYEIFSRFFEADGRPFSPLHVRAGRELAQE